MTKQWQRPGRDVRRYILRQEREIFVSRLCGLYVYALILLFLLLIILYQIFEARNPLDYVTVLLLGLGITFPFALSHYNRYRLFRRRPIGICYGSCVGKVYVCTRYVTEFTLDILLENGTLLEKLPVYSKICQEVQVGSPMLVARVKGRSILSKTVCEMRGAYLVLSPPGTPQ